jgi:hypothetical protein
MWEMFEDTKEVSRSRKLKKDIQYNGQKKKRQKKNNRFLHEFLLKIWDFFHECEKFRLFTSGA